MSGGRGSQDGRRRDDHGDSRGAAGFRQRNDRSGSRDSRGSDRGRSQDARRPRGDDRSGRSGGSFGRPGARGGFDRRDTPDRDDRQFREESVYPPGLEPREDEPQTPRDVDLRQLPRPVRAEMRTLSDRHAEIVGAHVWAAIELSDQDPELAHRHALAARRRAPRLPIIRELTAETAYAAGEWAQALSEYRAVRRMTGNDEVLPTMADCERALGHPEEALRIAREATRAGLSKEQRVEMRIVEAGARDDLGQHAEARRLLTSGVDEFIDAPAASQARLRAALAEHLLQRGKEEQALAWLRTAAQLDPDGESGAQDRLDELTGVGVDEGFDVILDEEDDSAAPYRRRAEEAPGHSATDDGSAAEPEAALASEVDPESDPDVALADAPDLDDDGLDVDLDVDEEPEH